LTAISPTRENSRMRPLLPCCVLIATALLIFGLTAAPFTPTSAYGTRRVEGFTVLVHPELNDHPRELEEALKELESQLRAVIKALKPEHLGELRAVRLWVEWNKRPQGAAEFHVSADWLKANGYNPDKVGAVEIGNAVNFVRWSRAAQPSMVLHELAHAYEHRVLGAGHAGIAAAYENAMDQKLYDSVKHVLGGTQRAYAATNSKEYFAELTEAYLGKNDFYPFTRAELERHDPQGFRLMQGVWK
jgi:hypothetical protein